MATRLPVVGQDDGTWGTLLNNFLAVEHNADGTLRKAGDIATAKAKADTAVQSVNGKSGTAVTLSAGDVGAVLSSDVGAANGVAPLDASGKVPSANLPSTSNAVTSVNTQTGDVVLTASDVGALTQTTADARYIQSTEEGAASGVATLDASGHIPTGQLPAGVGTLTVSQDGTAAGTQPEINFVSGSNVTLVTADDTANGRVNVTINSTAGGTGSSTLSGNTDVSITTPSDGDVLTYNTSTTKWENQVPATAPVTSVNTKTGDVVLGISDIATLQTTLNAKAPLASPTFTGTVTVPAPSAGTDAATKAYVDTNTANATTTTTGKVQLAGDLAGTATSPTVAKVKGVAVSGTPTSGQVLTATSASAASWQTPAAGGGGGGTTYNFTSITADYTASDKDYIFADSTAGMITVTLPAPVANAFVRVKRLNPPGNSVQVAAPAGSYIDASSVGTDTVNNQFQGQDYLSDGSNWYRV